MDFPNRPRFQIYLSSPPTEKETEILKRLVDEFHLPVMPDTRNVQPNFQDLQETACLIYTDEGKLITNYDYNGEHVIVLQWYCQYLTEREMEVVGQQWCEVYGGPPPRPLTKETEYLKDWGVLERTVAVCTPILQPAATALRQVIIPGEKDAIPLPPGLPPQEQYDAIIEHQKKVFMTDIEMKRE
jgi:hypothetical protein